MKEIRQTIEVNISTIHDNIHFHAIAGVEYFKEEIKLYLVTDTFF